MIWCFYDALLGENLSLFNFTLTTIMARELSFFILYIFDTWKHCLSLLTTIETGSNNKEPGRIDSSDGWVLKSAPNTFCLSINSSIVQFFCGCYNTFMIWSSKMILKSVKFNFGFSYWLFTSFAKLPFTTEPIEIGQLHGKYATLDIYGMWHLMATVASATVARGEWAGLCTLWQIKVKWRPW